MEENEETGGRRCSAAMFCGRTSLFIIMTGYALLGALLFKSLEGGDEDSVPVHVQKSREDCLKELWLITERLNVLYEKNWTKLVTEQLKRFERAVVESGRAEGLPSTGNDHWTFGGALLYSITLLTTVGYARLSPRTAAGKILAVVYAIIGVPLMLLLLSALGSLLASGTRKVYSKLCCKPALPKTYHHHTVGYHKAPSSPTMKRNCRSSHEDCALIQITTSHGSSNNCIKTNHQHQTEYQEVPKKALLATVRASNARGRCRQTQVRQMLADQHLCPQHPRGTLTRAVAGNIVCTSDVEEAEDGDENEHSSCVHDTPSRVPLIWHPPESSKRPSTPPPPQETSPSVPAAVVFLIFALYIALGAAALTTTSGWSVVDAIYFCFIALSTIGVGDKLPQSSDYQSQLQLFACCLYLFLGLVVVAMCFSLVHEDLHGRCRQFAVSVGLIRH